MIHDVLHGIINSKIQRREHDLLGNFLIDLDSWRIYIPELSQLV